MSSTIQEAFLKNIESGSYAGITLIEGEGNIEYMSYKKLYMEACYMLTDLQKKGLKPGDELVFQFVSNRNFLVTFWACIFGKMIPVPIVFGINPDTINKIGKVWKRLSNPYLITDLPTLTGSWKEAFHNGNGVFADFDKRFLLFEGISYSKQAVPLPATASDLAFIQFSSGSTGNPKGVTNLQGSIIHNINTLSNLIGLQPSDRLLGWMPLTHDLGLVFFHLLPLLTNLPQFLIPPMVFFAYPNLWLKSLAQNEITVSGSPNFGYRHALDNLKTGELTGLSFKKLRLMVNAAEPVSVGHCREFEKTLSAYGLKERTIVPGYGLAEAVLGVSVFQTREGITREYIVNRHKLKVGDSIEFVEAGSADAASFANVGQYYGTEIKITGKDMQALPEQTLGLIHLRSAAITSAFYNDPEATRETVSADGWLNTGDLGFICNNHLVITGRDKEMILVNGQNYFPNDIDAIIQELPGIGFQQAVSCNLFNEEQYQDDILVFLLYKGPVEDFIALEHMIRKHIGERTGLWIRKVIAVNKIPRTTSGKIQRYVLAEEYVQGKYDDFIKQVAGKTAMLKQELKELSKIQLEEKILQLVRTLFGKSNFTATGNYFDAGLSSVQIMRLKVNIESVLFTELDEVALFTYTSVKALAEHIYDHILHPGNTQGHQQQSASIDKNRLKKFIKPS